MTTPSLVRKSLHLVPLFLLWIVTACASQPTYSGDAGNFRFYILQVQKVDTLTLHEGKPITPDAGFVFLVVDFTVENKSSQAASGAFDPSSVNGRTNSGDYSYDEYSQASNPVSDFGPIPPGGRFKAAMTFQVAATTSDYRITIRLKGGLFGGPSTTIGLPPIGQSHPVSFPYASIKPTYLLKSGQSFPWFGNTTAVVEMLYRTSGFLDVQLKLNNTTGYVMSQQRPMIYWSVAVIGGDGSLALAGYPRNTIQTNFSLPPGQSGSVVYSIEIAAPDNLKGAVLTMGGAASGGEIKWMAFDLSDLQ